MTGCCLCGNQDLFFSSDDFYHGFSNKTATVLVAQGIDAIRVGDSPTCRTPNPAGEHPDRLMTFVARLRVHTGGALFCSRWVFYERHQLPRLWHRVSLIAKRLALSRG